MNYTFVLCCLFFNNTAQPTVITPTIVYTSEGNNVTIVCTATGVPVPSVTWTRADGSSLNDSRINSDTSSTMVVSGVWQVTRNLTITNIRRAESGVYVCRVTNVVNTVQNNVTIDVLCKLIRIIINFYNFYETCVIIIDLL